MSVPSQRSRDSPTHEPEMPKHTNNDDFLRKLDQGIATAGISPSHSIICAISGGTDSTALLLGLKHLENCFQSLTAAHYNHRARGRESDGDEEFVRQLCADTGIPLQVGHSTRQTEHLDENSARADRYRFLGMTADEAAADSIAVAHTIEDQAETVLFRLARGTGVRGASAMHPSRTLRTPSNRSLNLARPMLKITHKEAEQYLHSLSITARQDTSNEEWNKYARNRIRHRVMPELQAINSQATAAIARFGEILQLNSDLIRQLAHNTLDRSATESPNTYYRDAIASSHPAIAAEALSTVYRATAGSEAQLDQHHIDKLLDLISNGKSAKYHLPDSIVFWTNHEHIGMTRSDSSPEEPVPYPQPLQHPISLSLPGKANLGSGYTVTSEFSPLPTNYRRANDGEAWLRLDLFQSKHLSIRNRQPCDRFNPLGMNQNVDLSKFLINSKVAASWRDRIPLVVYPDDGRIIWLPGIRIADWAKVSPTDQTALHLQFHRDPCITLPKGMYL